MSFRFPFLIIILAGTILLNGCLSARVGPGLQRGLIFSYYKGPAFVNTRNSDGVPIYDDAKKQAGTTRKVRIPAPYTFGTLSFGWGDMSLNSMMKEGKMKEIDYVDYEYMNILNLYFSSSLVIYGR